MYLEYNLIFLSLPLFLTQNAIFIYEDPLNQRTQMSKDLRNKPGVYCWYNNLTGLFYIGSTVNLINGINRYFQNSYLLKRFSLIIVKALNKYGMINFTLIILEITEKDNVLNREQFYLDKLNPKYNLLKHAHNSTGFIHTEETKELLRIKKLGKKHTLEVKTRMNQSRKGENNNFFGKKHSKETILKLSEIAKSRTTLHKKGFTMEVIDTIYNTSKIYSSVREATKSLGTNMGTLLTRKKRGTKRLYKNRYNIIINRP